MLPRLVKPKDDYCLFFQDRKKGQRYEVGRPVWVFGFERWKHIKLNQFGIRLPNDDPKPDIITTAENLVCSVKADFKIVVGGGREKAEIEERLEKATRTCVATRNINETIEFDFFQKWAIDYCKNSIKNVISSCQFIALLDVTYRISAINAIKQHLAMNLENIGLSLLEATIIIEPMEPTSALVTRQISEEWSKYLQTIHEAYLANVKAEQEKRQKQAKLEGEHARNLKEIEARNREELREIEKEIQISEKKKLKEKETILSQIQEEIDNLNKETQVNSLKRDAAINKERENEEHKIHVMKQDNKFLLMKREQENERQLLIEQKEKIGLERGKVSLELELVELKEKIALNEIELEKKRGLAQAEVERQMNKAKNETQLQFQKEILTVLPQIVQDAYKPMEKMGKVNLLNIGGNTTSGNDNLLGTVISSATLLPMIKEVMAHVKDFSNLSIQGESAIETAQIINDLDKSNSSDGSHEADGRIPRY